MKPDATLDRLLEQRLWNPQPFDFVNSPIHAEGKRYRYDHDYVVKEARDSLAEIRGQAVSAFTGWIHKLYDKRNRDAEKSQGAADEREVDEKAQWFRQITGRASKVSRWENIYNTLENPKALAIPDLQVNGSPLLGMPDLVFQSYSRGEILIVERKVHSGTQRTAPEVCIDGWPDLRAQLWAYGHCESLMKRNGQIRLCADVWVREFPWKPVERRAVLNWSPKDPVFESQNRQLFDLYRSKCL